MKRTFGTALAALAFLLVTAGPAAAASVTVPGQAGGDISKMFVDNGASAVTVRIYGLPGPCQTRNVDAFLSWTGGPGRYHAAAGCYGGTTWARSLEYLPTGSVQNPVPVTCPGFALTYNTAGRFFRVFIPRSCLTKAPDRIRAASEAVVYGGSTIGGAAGPTKLLLRG